MAEEDISADVDSSRAVGQRINRRTGASSQRKPSRSGPTGLGGNADRRTVAGYGEAHGTADIKIGAADSEGSDDAIHAVADGTAERRPDGAVPLGNIICVAATGGRETAARVKIIVQHCERLDIRIRAAADADCPAPTSWHRPSAPRRLP